MTIHADRLWQRLEALAAITEPDQPWTRRSFTARFLEGREWLGGEFRGAGLDVSIDAGGNLVGRLPGSEPRLKPIILGSHSDTVSSGGRFDGTLGVLAALEVAQGIADQAEPLRHPLEIYDFLAEEPSEFGLSCVGSRALAGKLDASMLEMSRPDGMTLEEGVAYVGGDPNALRKLARGPGSIAAYLELHIEQGRLLESETIDIGIVTDIVGIRRERIVVTGRADHAGATPMPLRCDALVGAAEIVREAYRRAMAASAATKPLVATVGHIANHPNAANAVPGRVEMVLEVRSGDEDAMSAFGADLLRDLAPVLSQLRVSASAEPISHASPTPCSPELREAIARAADAEGLSWREMPSGAGHDAVFVAFTGPVGMIFVPCLDGRSHAPEEWLEPHQAAAGARVMARAVRRLDALLDR